MLIQKISDYWTIYTFDNIPEYSTNVVLIEKAARLYLIDTFCGPESMKPILADIEQIAENKELIIINTHFHWDHVWGNCAFEGKTIVCHQLCRNQLDAEWETQLNENSQYIMGNVKKQLPTLTFTDKLLFPEDGLELFYSPGHTLDGISIFDHDEKILYTGDNLEKPIIYVEHPDITTYINTLENYFRYCPNKILSSHTTLLTKNDVMDIISYLKNLQKGKEMTFDSEYENSVHLLNVKTVNTKI